MTSSSQKVVILSAYHDYRTAKRASIHQVADGLVRAGFDVSFVSTRFSRLSKRTGDSRLFLWDKANTVEQVNGVNCYLWRTQFHPFQSGRSWLNDLMARGFALYANLPDRRFDQFLKEADYVIIESSVAAIFLQRIRRLNPNARIIYYATDLLDTVGAHSFVQERLIADASLVDHVCLRSSKMIPHFNWAEGKRFRAEFGINAGDFESIGESPYAQGETSAVSVGSMLFDPGFFQIAARRFPNITFHVIGCGTTFDAPSNVVIHAEMPFRDTLPYVKHASLGVAPYRAAPNVEYLAESSLKLAQFEYFGIPAVCSDFAAGDVASRFGYIPGDEASIVDAIAAALQSVGKVQKRQFLSWDEVARRVVTPEHYPEARLG